jgi:hypothetical protein
MNDDHYNVVEISKASLRSHGVPERYYYCSYCNTRLTPLTQEDMLGGMSALNVRLNIGLSSNQ